MAKIVLPDLSSYSNVSTLNENFRKIQDALNEKILYRVNPEGSPNQMENALDMNSNDILNAGIVRAKHLVAESVTSGDKFPISGGLEDNEMIKWDKATGQLVGTGVKSNNEGEITTANNSVNIGIHDLGSSGRNIVFTNRVNHRHFSPIVQEFGLSDTNTRGAYQKAYGSLEDYQLYSGMNEIIADPNWKTTTVVNRTVFGLKFWPQTDMTNVIYKVFDQGVEIFSENLGDFKAGDNSSYKTLKTPYDLLTDSDFTFSLSSPDGVVSFKGGADGKPWFQLQIRKFEWKALATEEYVAMHGGGQGGGGDMFKSVYDKNGNNVVDEAERITGVTTAGNDKYYGTDSGGAVGFYTLPSEPADYAAQKAQIEANRVAINSHGTTIQQHENQISTNTNNIQTALQTAQSADNHLTTFRQSAVDGIRATVDHDAKTLTFTLTSQTGDVDHAMVDLSSWFAGAVVPTPTKFTIWSGWSTNPPMGEREITTLGTQKEVTSIKGLDIHLTRSSGATPQYMWVWIPQSVGTVTGFNFSGFTSVWHSNVVNVNGIAGEFFWSPNKTSATDVNFTVEA